jgi:trk system potassium uptake protein TrkA
MAKWTAVRYTGDHIMDYIELDEQHAIFEVKVPEAWLGKTVGAMDVRKRYGINILALKRGGISNFTVTPDTMLSGDTTLLALGELGALRKCFKI